MIDGQTHNTQQPNFALQILRRAQNSSLGEYKQIVRLVEEGFDNIPAINDELCKWRRGPRRADELPGYIPTVKEQLKEGPVNL